MTVDKLESRIIGAKLCKQPLHAKVTLANIRIVEQHDATRRELGPPRLVVVVDRLVGVEPVHVEQVDGTVLKVGDRLIECGAHQPGEG